MEVAEGKVGQRLDNFLLARLKGVPRSVVYRLIRTGQVRVNGKRSRPFAKLEAGDRVRIPPVRQATRAEVVVPGEVVRQLEAAIVHQDDDLLAVHKPAGLAVHGGSGVRWGVVDAFRQSRPKENIDLAHRLDRETSGLLLLARHPAALKHLQAQFSARLTGKKYFTLLDGRLPEDRMLVDEPLSKKQRSGERYMQVDPDGKPARTEFVRLEDYSGHTFAEVSPITGRTHQIRAHACHLGLPCAGDPRYSGEKSLEKWRSIGLERLFLHAHTLEFSDLAGERQVLSCPLPAELAGMLEKL